MEDKAKTRVDQLRELIAANRGISARELVELSTAAEEHGGELVSVANFEPGDDVCGTGRFRFRWPPKNGSLGAFIDLIINHGIGGGIIINGLPRPHEVLIEISRGAMRR